jgi:hypothetical protein
LEREQGIRPGLMMQSYFTVSLTGYSEALSPATNAHALYGWEGLDVRQSMKHILVYGKTLFLTGLMTQLQNVPDVQAQRCETLTGLDTLDHFDTVFIDLSDTRAADVLALLCARPDLRIIGVNAAMSAVTVISGQVYPAPTLGEVIGYLEPVEMPRADVSERILEGPAGGPASPAADLWE